MVNKLLSKATNMEQLFLRFLVGKSKIYKEDDYNDGLNEKEENNQDLNPEQENGWNQRILLSVEKERKMRVLEEKKLEERRKALLISRFQRSLLTTVNAKLTKTQTIISEHLQMHKECIELLTTLIVKDTRYSVLAELLDRNPHARNHVIGLVSNQDFMGRLGRSNRIVHDIQTAVGMIGINGLRYLIPALMFKRRINIYNQHNRLFTRKLWRYQLTLGQACTSLMLEEDYHRPYEGQMLSAMLNFAYTASFNEYLASFDHVRTDMIMAARKQDQGKVHDFFYELSSDLASLQSLLITKSDLMMSIALATPVFSKDFPHLIVALTEEVKGIEFDKRTQLGKILFKAVYFAKYEQLRAARLFKGEWLADYLKTAHIDQAAFQLLSKQELFRFKPDW
ncbi:HDOD domain-containing protein [Psychromonas sp. L1A2]|uniref:HDOD domain-containing protein n=1 Tax=Psychromonas sp. L1A2 TaxID=2686356 RepID=UPI00135C6A7A|nr:HDOD domain-containing protein [Psychromonas sp. L1A2]